MYVTLNAHAYAHIPILISYRKEQNESYSSEHGSMLCLHIIHTPTTVTLIPWYDTIRYDTSISFYWNPSKGVFNKQREHKLFYFSVILMLFVVYSFMYATYSYLTNMSVRGCRSVSLPGFNLDSLVEIPQNVDLFPWRIVDVCAQSTLFDCKICTNVLFLEMF